MEVEPTHRRARGRRWQAQRRRRCSDRHRTMTSGSQAATLRSGHHGLAAGPLHCTLWRGSKCTKKVGNTVKHAEERLNGQEMRKYWGGGAGGRGETVVSDADSHVFSFLR